MSESRFTELERAALHQHLSVDEDGRALVARRLAQVEQLAETMPGLDQLLDVLKTIAASYVARDAWQAVDESKWTPEMQDEYQPLRQVLEFPSEDDADADERSARTERLWARVSAELFPDGQEHLSEPLGPADASALVSSTFGAIAERAALPAWSIWPGRRPYMYIRVLIHRDGNCWVVRGLDKDVAVQARDIGDAISEFDRVLMTHVYLDVEEGREPLAHIRAAPREYIDKWQEEPRGELERIETRKVLLGAASSGPRAESPVLSGSTFAVRVARESAFLALQRSKARTQAMIAELALEHAAKGGAGAVDARGAPETATEGTDEES